MFFFVWSRQCQLLEQNVKVGEWNYSKQGSKVAQG